MKPKEQKTARIQLWVDKIKQNLINIENQLKEDDLDIDIILKNLQEQNRLITLIRNIKLGKTIFQGWVINK